MKGNQNKTKQVKNMKENKKTKQMSLFGGFIEEEQPPLEFVKVYEEVANDGDQFTLRPSTAKLKRDEETDEPKCLTLIDSEKNQALTVWFQNHPSAKSTPDGVRLGRAVERCLRIGIADIEDLEAFFQENDATLNITHNGEKGRLWVVSTND